MTGESVAPPSPLKRRQRPGRAPGTTASGHRAATDPRSPDRRIAGSPLRRRSVPWTGAEAMTARRPDDPTDKRGCREISGGRGTTTGSRRRWSWSPKSWSLDPLRIWVPLPMAGLAASASAESLAARKTPVTRCSAQRTRTPVAAEEPCASRPGAGPRRLPANPGESRTGWKKRLLRKRPLRAARPRTPRRRHGDGGPRDDIPREPSRFPPAGFPARPASLPAPSVNSGVRVARTSAERPTGVSFPETPRARVGPRRPRQVRFPS